MEDQTISRSKLIINAGRVPVTLNDIMNIVSEEDILAYYFHIYKLPSLINSPFRKDKNPSFSLYINASNKLVGYDFSTKQTYGIFDMLMEYYHMSFKDVLLKVWQDMCNIKTRSDIPKRKRVYISEHDIKFEVKTRAFRDYDLEYWASFGINQQWLRFGRVFAISDIIRKSKSQIMNLPADKYAYVYVEFKDNIQSLKIYQPFNSEYKWMGDCNCSIWSLWSQLPPTGDKLIITSSLKDALCLWANLHIPSCSLQSETTPPKPHVISQLKQRFQHVYILYDNDFQKKENTGQLNAVHLSKQYDLINICIDNSFKAKDPSDFYKMYGLKTFYTYFYDKISIYN